jgi:hypothetical protein
MIGIYLQNKGGILQRGEYYWVMKKANYFIRRGHCIEKVQLKKSVN